MKLNNAKTATPVEQRGFVATHDTLRKYDIDVISRQRLQVEDEVGILVFMTLSRRQRLHHLYQKYDGYNNKTI
ncbi:hypothetical protein HHA03_09350 [Halolactibacillus halophilus]|uniref:Uncharacterized protein n=1 Tax=Halolactibacillus halophilus TaxID=306540 RepID=A0ABQ0VJY5_9BACI|nr:hypothetical protein [Halolactibacillus halophilus]GEM01403.1 hypothetical protein HHA03_09350 [Halolactibacillus halophilus]